MPEYARISVRVFAAYSRVSVTYPRMDLVTSAMCRPTQPPSRAAHTNSPRLAPRPESSSAFSQFRDARPRGHHHFAASRSGIIFFLDESSITPSRSLPEWALMSMQSSISKGKALPMPY